MKNKEAKEKLYMQWQEFLEHNIDYSGISDAYKMAFKALEQMDVLDKIRTEVNAIETHGQIDEHTLFARSAEEVKNIVLEIIDKYRTVKGANE